MTVDCSSCQVRGLACQDCVIHVILGAAPPVTTEFTEDEAAALAALAGGGLVPPLRLVPPGPEAPPMGRVALG